MSGHDVVIRVENLSKAYLIGSRERAETFSGAVVGALRRPLRNLRNLRRLNTFNLADDMGDDDILWALRDLSFDVERGEVLGIIGRNGAGKSTLLKILSRVAEPTRGRVLLRGSVSALLEVGTGFHPELTGRENIYLNATILGMKRKEVDARFEDIVMFSGVGRFLDTPVKRYSSGMKVRLAFSVAAHLDPEILIVDEVLAVGDAEFQRKCLGKMKDVSRGDGRTVVFVSHNLGAVQSLCSKCLLLNDGRAMFLGDTNECLERYARLVGADEMCSFRDMSSYREGTDRMLSCELLINGVRSSIVEMGQALGIEVQFQMTDSRRSPRLGFRITTESGVSVVSANNRYQPCGEHGSGCFGGIRCDIGRVPLMEGRYHVTLSFGDARGDSHIETDALTFDVRPKNLWGTTQMPNRRSSLLWWPTTFTVNRSEEAAS